MKKSKKFDAAEYLDNDKVIAEYLNAALEDENPDVFLVAVSDIARARGMAKLARDTGLGRESLYKALSDSGNPAFATIVGVASALGYTFEMRAAPTKRAATGNRA